MTDTFIILSEKEWHKDFAKRLSEKFPDSKWILINSKQDFNSENLAKIKPRKIFIPHWSWIIPEEIFTSYECVVFHMTDLPFGRGGSPLQNLIVRGIKETKVSAIHVEAGIDTGPVYLKMPLTLEGTAEEIFVRAAGVIFEMIKKMMLSNNPPEPQKGDVVVFKRRKKEDGNIADLKSIDEIYDHIRMLDADTYPPAFLDFGDFVIEFTQASHMSDKSIKANVRITKK